MSLDDIDDEPLFDAPTPKSPAGPRTPARILRGVSVDDYHADQLGDGVPRLSASIAKKIVERTPEHARLAHPRLRTPAEAAEQESGATEARTRGSLLHKLVLGQGADIIRITAEDGTYPKDFKTKVAQEQRDAALEAGKIPALDRQLRRAETAAATIRKRLSTYGIVLDGESEVVVTWEERATDGTVVHCKCMIDHLRANIAQGVDLKTLVSADEGTCERQCNEYGHDIQTAAYRSALSKLFPRAAYQIGGVDFVFAFAEYLPPYAVSIAELDGEHLDLGMRRWARAVDIWARCLASGEWPATYSEERMRLRAKPWKLAEEEGRAA